MFDRAKSEAIRHGLNMALNGRYGKVQSLDLDAKQQRVDMSVLLNGESEAIEVAVGNYEIDESNPEKPFVVLRNLNVSRQWMQELATDKLEGQRIDIPSNMTGVIKMIL